jgi:hypothetical protein
MAQVAPPVTTGHTWYGVMAKKRNPKIELDQPVVYQIRLQGHLGSQWTDWFGGLTITLEETGNTLLAGPLADQAALHGLFKKVRDLGMPLLSVNRVSPIQAEVSKVNATSASISFKKERTQ